MFGGIAAAGNDRLVFATADGDVVTFDLESGKVEGQFSRFPTGPDQVQVSACAVGDDGQIYLADTRNHCVREFSPDGVQVRRFGRRALPGVEGQDEVGVLDDPCAIEFVDDGLLVACSGFDIEYGVQKVGGDPMYLAHPDRTWRRALGLARVGDEIWVAETEGGCIHRFRLDGGYIEAVPLPEELRRPLRLEFDGYDGVLALFAPEAEGEQEDLGVAQFTLDGMFEGWAVEAGEDSGRVYCPFDLAVLPDGRFVVADLPLGQPPDVRLQLFSADGRLLRTLLEDRIDLNAALREWFEALRERGSLFEQARVHHLYSGGSAEHLDTARELYQRALEAEPGDLLPRLYRAALLEPEQAEAEYRLALQCGGDPGDLAAHIAECKERRGDLDGAIQTLREAVEGEHPPEEYHRWVEILGTWYLRRAGAED